MADTSHSSTSVAPPSAENAIAHALAVGVTSNGPYHVSIMAVLNDLAKSGWTLVRADGVEHGAVLDKRCSLAMKEPHSYTACCGGGGELHDPCLTCLGEGFIDCGLSMDADPRENVREVIVCSSCKGSGNAS